MSLVVLSSNGMNANAVSAPPTRLLAAGAGAISILEREGHNAPWRKTGAQMEGKHAAGLAIDPRTGGVWAGFHHKDGVYYSPDGGNTWENRTGDLRITHVYSLRCIDTAEGSVVYVGTDPASLFRSRDGGKHWEELAAMNDVPGTEKWWFPAPPHHGHTKTIAIHPTNRDIIYVGVEQGALLKTTDGGRSWRELDSYYRHDDLWYKDFHQVMLSPANPDEVYFTMGIGLYHSRDGGETWTRKTDVQFRIGYPDQLAISPVDPKTIFIGGAEQDPSTWRKTHYANGAICRSRDGGATWEDLGGRGLPRTQRPNFEAVGTIKHPHGWTLMVGDTDGNLYLSEDSGDSFTQIAGDGALKPFSKSFHYAGLQKKWFEPHSVHRKAQAEGAAGVLAATVDGTPARA